MFICDLQVEGRKGKRGKTTAFKGTSLHKGTPSLARVQPPLELPGPSEPVTPANPNTRLCVFPDLFKRVVVRSFYDRAMASRNSGGNGTDGRRTNHETLLRRLQQVGNLLVVYLTQHNRDRKDQRREKNVRSSIYCMNWRIDWPYQFALVDQYLQKGTAALISQLLLHVVSLFLYKQKQHSFDEIRRRWATTVKTSKIKEMAPTGHHENCKTL